MSGAKKIATGEYAYRGYELAVNATGWRIREAGQNHYSIAGGDTKREAMALIEQMIEDAETREVAADKEQYAGMTDDELIAIDGVGWAWLEA